MKARKTKNRTARKTNKRAVKPWIGAIILRRIGSQIIERHARVPVNFDGITPSVPYIIKVEREYFVRTDTNPLRYMSATFAKGTLLGQL